MSASKTVRRSIAMTPQLRARLQQLLEQETRDITEADLIRQAIREFLDRQEDITGSRAHFRKTVGPKNFIYGKRWLMNKQNIAHWSDILFVMKLSF